MVVVCGADQGAVGADRVQAGVAAVIGDGYSVGYSSIFILLFSSFLCVFILISIFILFQHFFEFSHSPPQLFIFPIQPSIFDSQLHSDLILPLSLNIVQFISEDFDHVGQFVDF